MNSNNALGCEARIRIVGARFIGRLLSVTIAQKSALLQWCLGSNGLLWMCSCPPVRPVNARLKHDLHLIN